MREIKFKIWADNKFYDKCLIGNTNNINDDKWTCPMVWLEDRKEWAHCDNGIICQYTGLHDKNGKEIYEGDIILIDAYTYDSPEFDGDYLVEYNERLGMWIFKDLENKKDFKTFEDLDGWYRLDLKVLGNKYENLELLED